MPLELDRFTHLTFDCYGTLIDWEAGILAALAPVLGRHRVGVDEGRLLEIFVAKEAELEAGPYRRYREVLRGVMSSLGAELEIELTPQERDSLADSVGEWPPFADTVEALHHLERRYRLAIISNIDDDLFAATARRLGVEFAGVVTAEQVGSYKPSRQNFRVALERLGVASSQVLHVAQSLYHDHEPARELGLASVRVNRPSRRPGTGLAPEVDVTPDLEVPDLATLVERMGLV